MPDKEIPAEADNSVRADLERAFSAAAAKADDGATDPAAEPAKKPDIETPAAPKVDDKSATSGDDKAAKEPAKDPAKDDAIEPPVRWTKEEKEAWAKMTEGLAPEAVAAVKKIQSILIGRNKSMEGAFTQQMQAIAADRNYKAELDKVLQPRRAAWSKAGMSDAVALGQLLEGYEFSNRDPIGFINWVAQMRGIDLRRAFAAQPQGQQQQQQHGDDEVQLHPAVQRMLDQVNQRNQQLEQQLSQLTQGFQGVTGHLTQQQQMESQRLQSQVHMDLQQFESATDQNGAPKYPFFSDVRHDMARLIDSGMANDLGEAYDRAIYMRPDIRAKVTENHQMQQRREWEQKLADDAKRARAAGGSVVPSAPVVTHAQADQPAQDGSVRAALEAAVTAQLSRGRV